MVDLSCIRKHKRGKYGYTFPLIYSLRRKLSSEEAVTVNEGGCRRIERGASPFKWGLYAV